MSSPELPDNTDFLKTTLDHIKDLHPALRFVLVVFILIIFAVMFGLAIPDQFMPLIYIVLVGGMLFYLAWEFQQHKSKRNTTQDEYDYALKVKKLEQEHEDRERERQHEERMKTTTPTPSAENIPIYTADAETDYLISVISQTGKVSLLGIDPKAAGDDKDAKLNLSRVYTALLTADSEKMEQMGLEAWSDRQKPRRLSVLEQLDKQKRLVLLGDPGSGKTTFVNFMAMCMAGQLLEQDEINLSLLTAPLPDDEGKPSDEIQPWSHGALLPLRIVLRDFAVRGLPGKGKRGSERDLWRFVAAELEKQELNSCLIPLQTAFKEGRGLLLLDGLDEVPQAEERRDQIKQVVESFARHYGNARILVTSRPYAYERQDWRLQGFTDTRLLPFSDGQIRRFVDGWYAHTAVLRDMEAQQAEKRAEDLKQAIFNRPRLHELAERPLLLTLMSSLHAWRMGELPQQRQRLYEEAVDLLLDRWEMRQKVWDGEQERKHPSLQEYLNIKEHGKVRGLLNQLAYNAHAAQPTEQVGTADISQKELVDGLLSLTDDPNVKPKQLETYLRDRAGLLAPRGEGVYTFPHRTFQEYLAACYLTGHYDYPDILAELARQDPTRWREVLLLAGAKTAENVPNSIWNLADALYPETDKTPQALWGAHLAGLALAETADPAVPLNARNQKFKTRLQNGLQICITAPTLPARERALAGQSLGKLGDPRPQIMTVDEMGFCYVPAGAFQMNDKKDERLNYDYWMSQHLISNAQFAVFTKDGGYRQEKYWTEAKNVDRWSDGQIRDYAGRRNEPNDFGMPYSLPNHPVVGITWYEMLAFTRWLGDRWRANGVLPADWGVMLPSEAEWEKAGRGGLQLPASQEMVTPADGWAKMLPSVPNNDVERKYPWIGDLDAEKANVKENNIGATSAPGSFPDGASPYGVQDMSGNVWEWMRSLYDDYPNEPTDPKAALNAGTSEYRTLRGGAYYEDARSCGLARRSYYDPYKREQQSRFACCRFPVFHR